MQKYWLLMLSLCSSAYAIEIAAFSKAKGQAVPPSWHVMGLPEQYNKPLTKFELVELPERVLQLKAEKSWGTLVHEVSDSVTPGAKLHWRWRLDQALPKADVRVKASEDSALKICASFKMPLEQVPFGERTLIRLAQLTAKAPIPTAVLCYTWGSKEPLGTEQTSLYTARVRFIVLANESTPLKTWQSQERDVYADFRKLFGSESGTVPPLSAIMIGADSDNTASTSLGFVDDVQWRPAP
jgi:hypothetical protein